MSGNDAQGRPCACPAPERLEEGAGAGRVCAVVVAGGSGQRFGDPRGKQFVPLHGMPLICWSVLAMDRAPSVGKVVVVAPAGRAQEMRALIQENLTLRCPLALAEAGPTRQGSVANGLAQVGEGFDLVAVHDGARPLARPRTLEAVADRVRGEARLAGAIAACPSTDTLKLVEGATIVSTADRSFYWCAQTPQVFRTQALLEAYRAAAREGYQGTDDASLVEHCGGRVACVETPRDNIKVTLPEDLTIAEALLARRLAEEGCGLA